MSCHAKGGEATGPRFDRFSTQLLFWPQTVGGVLTPESLVRMRGGEFWLGETFCHSTHTVFPVIFVRIMIRQLQKTNYSPWVPWPVLLGAEPDQVTLSSAHSHKSGYFLKTKQDKIRICFILGCIFLLFESADRSVWICEFHACHQPVSLVPISHPQKG